MEIEYLILLSVIAVGVSLFVWIFWAVFIGAGWEPTSKRVIGKMLDMAEANSEDVVYDLGSGDGRIVIEAAKKYNSRAVGIEADPIRVLWSFIMVRFSKLHDKVKIKWGNLFNQDISSASIVTLFLWNSSNQKLKPKLLNELKPGTRVVSYVWMFNGWVPAKEDKKDRIYLYIIGESDNYILE